MQGNGRECPVKPSSADGEHIVREPRMMGDAHQKAAVKQCVRSLIVSQCRDLRKTTIRKQCCQSKVSSQSVTRHSCKCS